MTLILTPENLQDVITGLSAQKALILEFESGEPEAEAEIRRIEFLRRRFETEREQHAS